MDKRLLIGGTVGLLVAGGALYQVLPGAPSEPPNVLIILWDTVRADRMTLYGYDKPTTPRMAKWAEGGKVFENAISPAMWTVPSHASMFTGQPESEHGAGYDWRWLDHHNITSAEWFGQHGYDTYAFSANPNLSSTRVNLLQGFNHIDLSWNREWRKKVSQNTRKKLIKSDKSTEISPAFRGGASSTFTYNAAPQTREAFVDWIDGRDDPEKPFFAYLSYMEAHKPRVPSAEARKKVADDETIKLGLATDLTMKSQLLYSYDKKDYTEKELQAIDAVYDATLIDLDESTSDLLADLEERGVLDNTIVLWTADHGEQLGEHQQFGHRAAIYQNLLHVPLVISWPAGLDPGRVSVPVSNLQIYDTLCDLAGVPRPDQPMATGTLTDITNKASAIFAQSMSVDRLGWQKVNQWFPDVADDLWGDTYQVVIDGGFKLIEGSRDGRASIRALYDLRTDPDELNDLAATDVDRLTEMTATLATWTQSLPAYDATKRTDQDVPPQESEAEKAQLAILGYAEPDDPGEEGSAPAGSGPERTKAKGKAGKSKSEE